MKLIDEKEVEEAANETSLWIEKRAFWNGATFAEQKLLPMMTEFKEWCDQNEREIRLNNMDTDNPAITTEQLLEQFLNRDK